MDESNNNKKKCFWTKKSQDQTMKKTDAIAMIFGRRKKSFWTTTKQEKNIKRRFLTIVLNFKSM